MVFRTRIWPLLAGGGLLIAAFSLVPWGTSSEGVQPTVSGLGRVAVAGATPDDVAFLESHTERPGLVTVILGAVIVAAALVGWAVPKSRWIVLAVIALSGLGASAVAVATMINPASHLFDDAVNSALGDGTLVLSTGYGVFGVLVVGIGVVGVVVAGVVARRHPGPGDS